MERRRRKEDEGRQGRDGEAGVERRSIYPLVAIRRGRRKGNKAAERGALLCGTAVMRGAFCVRVRAGEARLASGAEHEQLGQAGKGQAPRPHQSKPLLNESVYAIFECFGAS